MRPPLRLLALLSVCLSVPALAQGPVPSSNVTGGDLVRVWILPVVPGQRAPLEGRIHSVGRDSLILSDAGVAWGDVERLERRGQDHGRERAGIGIGLLVGGGLGWLVAYGTDAFIPVPHVLAGAVLGGTVGAVVGAHSRRQWVEVPLGGAALGLRVVVSL